MIRNFFGKIFPFLGAAGHESDDTMQRSGDWEQIQTNNDDIPSHEFLETQDNKDVSSGDIEEHPFLDSTEFVDVTGTSDPDVSIEIKAHSLLTESGEHMLVTPVYSPRSGSSVDPADKIPLHLINSPSSPLAHDGSGDKVTAQEMETGDGVEGKQKDDRDDKGMKAGGDRKGVKCKTPDIAVLQVVDSKEMNLEAAVEKAQELKEREKKAEVEKTKPAPVSEGATGSLQSDIPGDYISYVHHMTANKKLIKAKDLFYQLGFQKGVSKSEIENAAIEQYKLAASKQAKFWVKDARYFAEILFSGSWIDQNLAPLDGRSGNRNRGNKKKKEKNKNINEQFEVPRGTCRDFRLKENPDLQTVRENAADSGPAKSDKTDKSEESLDKFVSDYTNNVIDQAIKIAIGDGLSESTIMEVIEDVTTANLRDTPRKGKLTPLDPSRAPRSRPDQLAMGFNYHADVVVKESPKTVHGEIIPIDLSKQPREKPEQIAIGFGYHSDVIVKESPRAPTGEIIVKSSPSTPRRRARDQLAMGFSYHSKLLAKDVVVDHNENIPKAENMNLDNGTRDNAKHESIENVTPEKSDGGESIVPKSAKKSISDTFAVGFSYNSDMMMKESQDQVNGNADAQDTESENVEKNTDIAEKTGQNEEINGEVLENGDLNGNMAELVDMAGEMKLAGSVW